MHILPQAVTEQSAERPTFSLLGIYILRGDLKSIWVWQGALCNLQHLFSLRPLASVELEVVAIWELLPAPMRLILISVKHVLRGTEAECQLECVLGAACR